MYLHMYILHMYPCIHECIPYWNMHQHAYVCTRVCVGICCRNHSRRLLRTQTHAHMNVHTYIKIYTHARAHMQIHTPTHKYAVYFEHTDTLCTHEHNRRHSHSYTYMHTQIPYTPDKAKARNTVDTPFWPTGCAHTNLSTASESLSVLQCVAAHRASHSVCCSTPSESLSLFVSKNPEKPKKVSVDLTRHTYDGRCKRLVSP